MPDKKSSEDSVFPLKHVVDHKKKLAPRSRFQFKVGPEFSDTVSKTPIINSKGDVFEPILTPRIDRGFEKIDAEWVGYKRNYFTLVCAFMFKNLSFEDFAKETFYVTDEKSANQRTRIRYFALRLISKCADDSTAVSLIQHTAKRDRGPQFAPPIFPSVPGLLPNHNVIKEAANVRNTNKITKLNKTFFFDKSQHNPDGFDITGLVDYPDSKIIKVARYERIQFSSSINYKKPSLNNKRFKLFVELVGFTDSEEYLPLAYSETPPLIVRGRSPSNYSHFNISNHKAEPVTSDVEPSDVLTEKRVKEEEKNIIKSDEVSKSYSFNGSLSDLAIFEIIVQANKELDEGTHLSDATKKKRGKKSKTGNTKIKSKQPRKSKSTCSPIKKLKSVKERKSHSEKHKSPSKKGLAQENFKRERKAMKNSLLNKLKKAYETHLKSPSSSVGEICNYSFDNSALGALELQTSADFSFPNILQSRTQTLFHGENYDRDFLLLKSRVEVLQRAEDELIKSFSKLQSNPSEMLTTGEFDDGPSFMFLD